MTGTSRDDEVLGVVGLLEPGLEGGVVESLGHRPGKADVFVVRSLVGPGRAVVAKLQDARTSDLEARIYREMLDPLDVQSIRCLGLVPSSDPALAWLVTEFAHGAPFDRRSPEHAASLGRWIGAVHRGAARSGEGALPDHGVGYWREVVREAVDVLRVGAENPAVAEDEARGLVDLSDALGQVLRTWSTIASWMDVLPETLTHGDLVPQNITMGGSTPDIVPRIHDWGEAGWGSPVIDLLWVDVASYLDALGAVPDLPSSAERLLRAVGTVLWTAFVLLGERPALSSPWPGRAARKAPAYLGLLERRGLEQLTAAGARP